LVDVPFRKALQIRAEDLAPLADLLIFFLEKYGTRSTATVISKTKKELK